MPGLIFIKVRRKSCSKLNFLAGPVHVPLRAKNCWKGEGIFGVSLSVCFVPLQYCMFWALGRRYPNKHLNAWVDGRPVLNFTSNSLVNCSNRMGMVVEGSFSSSFELSDVSPWASSLSSPDCQAASRVTWPFFLKTISSPLLRRIGMKMFWQRQKHRRIVGQIIRADVRSLSTWHWVKVVASTFNHLLSPSFSQVGVLRRLGKHQFWNVWPFYTERTLDNACRCHNILPQNDVFWHTKAGNHPCPHTYCMSAARSPQCFCTNWNMAEKTLKWSITNVGVIGKTHKCCYAASLSQKGLI